uniref:Adenomatous polyposis coli protein n=1 Tax=Planaria torva TaxID=2066000 RepID=A0AA51NHM1_9PLAT|nr:adenomatous polyposis coli protein [Planaria torva]
MLMSFNAYKKEFYASPRHLSILRESPEDMFLNGERSEDIYVNFEDRSIINNSCLSFVKPLPARPTKPPPPLPNSVSQPIEPVHPPVPIRVSSNPVTMVTASTQTNRGTCIEGNVPDILAFTLNSQDNCNVNGGSPTYQYDNPFAFIPNYDCMGKTDIGYPNELMSSSNNIDLGSYITKFIDMMHDPLSWSVESSGGVTGSGCTPQLDISRFEMRRNAEKEFYQILNDHIDISMREYYLRVFGAIQQIRNYCETLRVIAQYHNLTELNNYLDYEPGEAACNLMKMSFNENYRRIICSLGGLEALSQLIVINHGVLGDMANNYHLTVRRYTCMALTNLTFGIGENKSLLCSIEPVLLTLVEFLSSCSEEVKQVSASVIRNLSWKADDEIKLRLKEANISKILTTESMKCAKESCLKSVLSALWNISAHSKENKVDICEVSGALAYFVDILSFKTIALVESSGGILRNISGVISSSEKYRSILRQENAFQILLKHLRSSSLTVVGNACGTLCSLSSDCQNDQQLLWDLGAVGMLKNLVHSKHRTISIGSASTLKNLLAARASLNIGEQTLINALKSSSTSSSTTPDSSPRIMSPSPSLHVRKLSALESEIENVLRNNQTVSLSSDSKGMHDLYSIESPLMFRQAMNNYCIGSNPTESSQLATMSVNSTNIKRSDSDDSIVSAHSDLTYDKVNFQSVNPKMKLSANCQSKQSTLANNFMSLSGYTNSSGHYDLTIEHCMKISNLTMNNIGSILSNNSGIIDQNQSNGNLKKRNFHSYPDDYDSDNSEKPLDYSTQFGDTDEYMTYPAPIIQNQNESSQIGAQVNVFRNIINIPPPTIKEKPKVYATEGTPIQCGSRMSPLSEELEEDDPMNHDPNNQYNARPIIHEDACCFPVSKKPDLEKIDERANSEIRENYDNNKSNKSVKFESEPPHIIQDTPLMFSRSSSVESLDSFETHSFHSSVQSEYSRRTSEAVSPCELPDSPGSDNCQRRDVKSAQTTKSKNSNSISYSSSLSNEDNISIGNSNNSSSILQQCIESGMPNVKSSTVTNKSMKMIKTNNRFIDELETAVCYAVEDTPYNYSTKASSLSDISISDPCNIKEDLLDSNKSSSTSSSDTEEHSELLSEIIQSAMPKGINSSSSFAPIQSSVNYIQTDQLNAGSNCSTFMAQMSNAEYGETYPMVAPHKVMKPQIDNGTDVNISKLSQFFYCDIDSPRQYGVEGTPNSLSQRDSICSETNLMIKMSTDALPLKPSQVPPKPPKRTTSTLSSVPEKVTPLHVNDDVSHEECHVYMTENTPADYSRASPISHSLLDTPSLHDTEDKAAKESHSSTDYGSNQESKSINDDKSSLSSLSIESAGMERTLLQQCISSAMPTPKLKQPAMYSRRNHSSDHVLASKTKTRIQTELLAGDNDKNVMKCNPGNHSDGVITSLNIDAKRKAKPTSKLKKLSDYRTESPDTKSVPITDSTVLTKSRLPEPKVGAKSSIATHSYSKSANESLVSSKPSSEKSVNSCPKSKSSCSLKSVLRYNSCMPMKQNQKSQSPKIDEKAPDKHLKAKSELSKNCHFLVNGFDVNPNGLAASKSNSAEASPITEESQRSSASVDNHTYSIDDKARIDRLQRNDADIASESDTLELVEITGFMDDDFLKDDSSSLEIDAALCRNAVMRGPLSLSHDTDEDLTDDEFNDSFNENNFKNNKVIDDIMKDGVEAVLSSLNSQFCTGDFSGNVSDFLSFNGSEYGDSLTFDLKANHVRTSFNGPTNEDKPKSGPRIVKPTNYNTVSDNDSLSSSSQSIGIRGGRKSLIGRKAPTGSVVNSKLHKLNSTSTSKPDIKEAKTARPVTGRGPVPKSSTAVTAGRRPTSALTTTTTTTAVARKTNTTTAQTARTTKPNVVTGRSSLPTLQNRRCTLSQAGSKIPGLSSLSNVALRTKTGPKIDEQQRQRARSSTELRSLNGNGDLRNEGSPCNNGDEEEEDDDEGSEGVWIVRKELCPDTVCIQ